jgi:membrane protein
MANASHTESDRIASSRSGPARGGGYGRILVRAVRRSMQDHVPNLAQAVAFNTFLAIPSGLLVALGVFTLVSSPTDVSTLISHLRGVVPASVIQLLNQSLQRARASGGGEAMIAVGAVIALWSLTSAMTTIQWAINLAYEHQTRRGFVRTRLAALGMVACILVAFGLVVVVQVLGPVMTAWLGSTLGEQAAINWIWWIAQWPVLIGGLLAAFAGILFLGPDVDRRRYRLVTVGSLVATVIWVLASLGFAYYVDNFGSYNKTWGSLSAVIVMLTWLWLTSLALLFGAEINAEVERTRGLG